MGLSFVIAQNGGIQDIVSLNTSVLNKMPRDCTALLLRRREPGKSPLTMYSPSYDSEGSHTRIMNRKPQQPVATKTVTTVTQSSQGKKKNKNKKSKSSRKTERSFLRVDLNEFYKIKPDFGGKIVSNTTNLPSAFVNVLGNTCYYQASSQVQNPNLGIDGCRLIGCQPFQDVTTDATTTNLLVDATLATQNNANSILISPDRLNGPLAARANLYDRFVFRDIIFEYVSLVATSQAGGMAMGVMHEGAALGLATNFSTTRQIVPSVAFPFRTDRAYLHVHYDGPELYFNAADTASLAGARQTEQYVFNAWPSVTSIGAVSQGFINIYYIIDLYDPVPSQGFTLSVSNKTERDLLKRIADKIKEPKDKDRILSTLLLTSKP